MKVKLTLQQLIMIQLILISAVVVSTLTFDMLAHISNNEQLDEINELASNPQTTIGEQRQSFQDIKDIKKAMNITND